MSGERLVVNFASLETANQQIQTAISTMRTKLDELESAAKPLVASWAGEAQTDYAARQAKWRQAADDLTMILQDIQKSLASSAAEYQATEQANARLFG